MQTLTLHRAMGLVAGRRVVGFDKQAKGSLVEHRKAMTVAVSVVEPDTTCTASTCTCMSAPDTTV